MEKDQTKKDQTIIQLATELVEEILKMEEHEALETIEETKAICKDSGIMTGSVDIFFDEIYRISIKFRKRRGVS